MSLFYDPTANAAPIVPWSTALLAQRDVSQQIPINFVTNPAISLTAACFGDGRYEDDIAETCVSNLLAIGFRRLLVDVYWDASRHVWSLCPVEVPESSSGNTASPSAGAPISSSAYISSVQLSNPTKAARIDRLGSTSSTMISKETRQIASSTSTSLSASSGSGSIATEGSSESTTSISSIAPTASMLSSPSGPLYRLGPYSCTSSIQLPLIAKVVSRYLDSSETTLAAFLQYLQINVHAAASLDNPLGPALLVANSDLPSPGNLLSDVLTQNLSSYLYTPKILFSDRADLNASWYSVLENHYPDSNYFTSELGYGGIHTTSDGWPCEVYLQIERFHRLLLSFGSVDPQMSGYDSDADGAFIFEPGYIQQVQTTSESPDGQITSGCFFNANIDSISRANNSWAFGSHIILPSGDPSTLAATNVSISNLTSCGISPLVDQTILNSTADNATSVPLYTSLTDSAIWSWAPNEPANNSTFSPYYASVGDQLSPSQFRCAVFNALSNPPGRWHVADCTGRHYAACRSDTNPYIWSISSDRGTYIEVEDNCPDGSTFAVPRTALENSHLLSILRSTRPDILQPAPPGDPDGDNDDDSSSGNIWINFNSLGTANCWVTGVNQTCPYVTADNGERRTQVIVPTVAAVIVLCLGILTMFVKCAANRQSSRRRRRRKGEGGWDYEGVPS